MNNIKDLLNELQLAIESSDGSINESQSVVLTELFIISS